MLTHEVINPVDTAGAASAADTRPHAVVIGTGFGGLAAAIRLGARGYRVTCLEKLDAPGGRAYVYRQDGFTFDGGPTIITAPFLLEELWRLCGKQMSDHVTLVPMDPFYHIQFSDGQHFDYNGDPLHVHREIARFNPADVDGYERYMAMSEKIYEFGFAKLGMVPFNYLMDMVRAVPGLVRLKAHKSVYSLVADFIRDEYVRIVLSFHPLLIGGSPFRAPSTYCLISHLERTWGVHSAMGGTGKIVAELVKLINGQGNRVRYNAGVDEILVDNGQARGVRLTSGEVIKSDLVVSNADAAATARYLVPDHVRKRWTNRKLDKMHYSMSLFVWYFGTDRQYEQVKHHSIVLGPRYKPLLDDMFKRQHLAEDFSLYLHRPTATDPSMAPPGGDAFYALSPVPHLGSGVDWHERAEAYRQKIQEFLQARMLPNLDRHIVTSRILTPIDFRDRLSSVNGAAFGFEPLAQQAGWFRPHNRFEDVEGLYLVGGGTHPGAGIPGVIASAKVLDHVVPDPVSR